MKHWYHVRTVNDAPYMANSTFAVVWAEGYNDAVKAYVAELDEAARRERQPDTGPDQGSG